MRRTWKLLAIAAMCGGCASADAPEGYIGSSPKPANRMATFAGTALPMIAEDPDNSWIVRYAGGKTYYLAGPVTDNQYPCEIVVGEDRVFRYHYRTLVDHPLYPVVERMSVQFTSQVWDLHEHLKVYKQLCNRQSLPAGPGS